MWLLDANRDVHLVPVLADLGVQCETAATRGWKGLSNGQLVWSAVRDGFDYLLTRDRLFGQSASQALKTYPGFSVVHVRLPQQRWAQYRRQFL